MRFSVVVDVVVDILDSSSRKNAERPKEKTTLNGRRKVFFPVSSFLSA
jgi:hypothetical protein